MGDAMKSAPQTTGRNIPARALPISDFAKAFGVSRRFVYDCIARGDLRTITLGTKKLVVVPTKLDPLPRLLAPKAEQLPETSELVA
jgi:hypothetical protein